MVRMPEARWKPVRNYTPHGSLEQRGLVLHVQEGDNSPWGWFNSDEAEASSDFWVAKNGTIEQYVNTGTDRAWAQAAGNAYYASVETEGYVSQALTAEQVEGVAKIYAWGHQQFGWPLTVVDSTTEHGLTYHGVGGSYWGGHTGCPGDLRKAQRQQIIDRAGELLGQAPPSAPAWPGRYLHLASPMMQGEDIRTWQRQMAARGWSVTVDGWYGKETDGVCRRFQEDSTAHNWPLDVDGIVGLKTWSAAWTRPVS